MKKIFTIAALLVFTATLSAQQEGTYNESVVVKGSYRPTIEQAEKILLKRYARQLTFVQAEKMSLLLSTAQIQQ